MLHQNVSQKTKCPICSSETKDKNIHFFKYRICLSCGHSFSSISTKASIKYYHNIHLREMISNGEIIQQTVTMNHINRMNYVAEEKREMLKMFALTGKRILDLEAETGMLTVEDGEIISLTQIPHIKNNLLSSIYGTINDIEGQFDAIISFNYIEYKKDIFKEAPFILNKLKTDGKWIVSIPIDNDPSKNYTGRIHEFTNHSSILFATKINYDFEIFNKEDSIVFVFSK